MYQDYDSDSDVPDELKQDYVDEQTGDMPVKRSVPDFFNIVTDDLGISTGRVPTYIIHLFRCG